ncbi:MAG: N-acetyltransferase, partial [Sphingomonas bacterium]|nr:N-acetyltransferase [Sphingomonas bacterium]
ATVPTSLHPIDHAAQEEVEALLDAAFGADRHQRTAYRLRQGTEALPGLSLAAIEPGGGLVGTIQCWPIELAPEIGAPAPLVLVGPVAVHPGRQGDGIGRLLMRAMLDAAETRDEHGLVLIGDPAYYGRFFGFDATPTAGWTVPGPVERHRLLARLAGRDVPAHGALRARPVQKQPDIG